MLCILLLEDLHECYKAQVRRYKQQLLIAMARYEGEHHFSLSYNKVIALTGLDFLMISLPEFTPPDHHSALITMVQWCQSKFHPRLIHFVNDRIDALTWNRHSPNRTVERKILKAGILILSVLSVFIYFVLTLIRGGFAPFYQQSVAQETTGCAHSAPKTSAKETQERADISVADRERKVDKEELKDDLDNTSPSSDEVRKSPEGNENKVDGPQAETDSADD